MELFKLGSNYLVELDKEWISTIQEFRVLLKRDKDREKRHAQAEFTYIYHLCDYRSQFNNYGEKEREQESLRNSGLEKKDIDLEVKAGIERYKALRETRALRLINAGFKGIDKLEDYFNNVDLLETDRTGKLVHSSTTLMKNIKDLGTALEGLKSLESQIKKELALKEEGIRGDQEKGYDEDPEN